MRDLPFHLIRPHIAVMSVAALSALPSKHTLALADKGSAATSPFVAGHDLPVELKESGFAITYEEYFTTDAADQIRNTYFDTLLSLTSTMSPGNQQIHACCPKLHVLSRNADRDNGVIFSVAARLVE